MTHPMGPLRLTDLVGLEVRLAIAEYLHAELSSDAFRPPEILRTIAAYCESIGGQLVRLSKTGDHFEFDYQIPSGRKTEETSVSQMYNFAYQMYWKREEKVPE